MYRDPVQWLMAQSFNMVGPRVKGVCVCGGGIKAIYSNHKKGINIWILVECFHLLRLDRPEILLAIHRQLNHLSKQQYCHGSADTLASCYCGTDKTIVKHDS